MSAPMINWVPLVSQAYKYLTSGRDHALQTIDLPSVSIHDVETSPEKRPRTLKHLLKANHVNHAILYHDLEFSNHMPHILGSAYLLGASPDQLQAIYDNESKELEEWEDSPAEISAQDWRNYLGNAHYQRAFVDFFEDELALNYGYDWKRVADEYLFSGPAPLINGLIGNLGHPLIHLGYAYEFSSREVGMEALAMLATQYSPYHQYLDDPSYTKPSIYSTTSPLEILHKIAADTRFDSLFPSKGPQNIEILFSSHAPLLLEHWNAWTLSSPISQFQDSQDAAIALLFGTVKPGSHSYDFFLVHLLTTSHAVRILLPLIPKKFQISLVRQWWLLFLAVYIAQLRPKISEQMEGKPTKSWKEIEQFAVDGPYRTDSHFLKAIRAIREAAFTWGDVHERYLFAAQTLTDDFKGWVFD